MLVYQDDALCNSHSLRDAVHLTPAENSQEVILVLLTYGYLHQDFALSQNSEGFEKRLHA